MIRNGKCCCKNEVCAHVFDDLVEGRSLTQSLIWVADKIEDLKNPEITYEQRNRAIDNIYSYLESMIVRVATISTFLCEDQE